MISRGLFPLLLMLAASGCSMSRMTNRAGNAEPEATIPDRVEPVPPATPAPAPTPTPPEVPVPPSGPFIVLFDWDQEDLTAAQAAILDEAARAYHEAGAINVRLAYRDGSGPRADSDRGHEESRLAATRQYLATRDVPVSVRAPSGAWLMVVEAPPAAEPVTPPRSTPPDRRTDRARPPASANGTRASPPAGMDERASLRQLAARRNWLTPTGTVTQLALEALMQECIRLDGAVTAECQAAVTSAEGGFQLAPEDVRREFTLLLNACGGGRPGEDCAGAVALEREFRALPRGQLDPQPRTMVEGEETVFTAFITDTLTPDQAGRPGVAIGAPGVEGGSGPGSGPAVAILPYSRQMCFRLTANPRDFLIDPANDVCPGILAGGTVRYNPQWTVTPQRPGDLKLFLMTRIYINSIAHDYPHRPYPLLIDVRRARSWWDWFDGIIERAIRTVNSMTALAKALGSLFAVVAGWGLWSWFKRRRKRKRARSGGAGAAVRGKRHSA